MEHLNPISGPPDIWREIACIILSVEKKEATWVQVTERNDLWYLRFWYHVKKGLNDLQRKI
jgi:hypothetical protein